LHNPTTPFGLAESFQGIVNTTGNIACSFSGATIGNSYYIVIKHRNAVETWSASPVAITTITSYDFSTAANKAFGNNQKLMDGLFALYSGDVNQDGVCDVTDFNLTSADVRIISLGYKKTDLNGDGVVDVSDFNILAANVRAIVSKLRP